MFMTKYRPHRGHDSFFDFPFFGRYATEGGKDEKFYRTPLTNIEETDGGYLLTMEVPGLEKADVNVSIENDQLTITAEKKEEEKTESKGLLRREIRSSRFSRSFTIGDGIDRDSIKAKLDNGVLKVTLQKTEKQVGRKVDVD